MKMKIILVVICQLCLIALTNAQVDDLPKVLPPIIANGDEVGLLLVPGAYINALMYQPLGIALQQASPLRLWIGLVGPFTSDLPNPSECSASIEATLQMMEEQGMNSSVIYLAGHSLGGVVMQTWIWEHSELVSGFALMGSELNQITLAQVPVPVMHISGDLDGMQTVAEMAPTYQQLQGLVAVDPGHRITDPVVILQDVNHMLFASGTPPPLVESGDILSPLEQSYAQALIATHMMAFITATSGLPSENVASSQVILTQDYNTTADIMKPLFESYSLTDGNTSSEWSVIGQKVISSADTDYYNFISVQDTILSDYQEFVNSRPSLMPGDVTVFLSTYTHVTYPNTVNSEDFVSPSETAVKFKSSEAIMEQLEPIGATFSGNTSCKLVNEAGLSLALASVSDVQKQRYDTRSKQILFAEDDEKSTGEGWVNNSIRYNETDTSLNVTSIALHTSLEAGFGLDGMHYCKMMPPARMTEYILIQSLRGSEP